MKRAYVCPTCGTIVDLVYGDNIPSCCGAPMVPAEIKTEDYVKEKHVPYIEKVDGGVIVKVGKETEHPMTPEHYIRYIEIIADGIVMREYLQPGDHPEAFFETEAKEIIATKGGFLKSKWCGSLECELAMKEQVGVTSRCMPLQQSRSIGKCPVCGKECGTDIYWAVAY